MLSERKIGDALLDIDRIKFHVNDLNPLLAKHLIGKQLPGQVMPFGGISPGKSIMNEEKIRELLSDLSFDPFTKQAKQKLPGNWKNLREIATTHPVVILTGSGLVFARNSEKEWKIKHGLDNAFVRLFRKPRIYLTELLPMPISK